IGVDDAEQIERGITAFARAPNGGLIVLAQPRTLVHRGSIIKFATDHQLPAVYNSRLFTAGGGLISYGGKYSRPVTPSGSIRRSHSEGRETNRSARSAVPAALVLDRKKLAAFSAAAGRFLQFPIGAFVRLGRASACVSPAMRRCSASWRWCGVILRGR